LNTFFFLKKNLFSLTNWAQELNSGLFDKDGRLNFIILNTNKMEIHFKNVSYLEFYS